MRTRTRTTTTTGTSVVLHLLENSVRIEQSAVKKVGSSGSNTVSVFSQVSVMVCE